jgi:hypothetical protein
MTEKLLQPLEQLFRELIGDWLTEQYPQAVNVKSAAMVFPDAVTAWLMISQKTIKSDTLSGAVGYLRKLDNETGVGQWLRNSKRYRLMDFSLYPGGFSQARARLPLSMVEDLVRELTERAEAEHVSQAQLYGRQFYVLDGTQLNLQNSAAIRKVFASTSNQLGKQRPVARVVVAHNVVTAIALAPEIASTAESEQALAARVMQRMKRGSVVIGDRNFGVFSIAWAARQQRMYSIVRLQEVRALRLLGKQEIGQDGDYEVRWVPTEKERKKHALPEDAVVDGRIVVITPQIPGARRERLLLFTTLKDLTPEQIADAYRRRWFIEQDLRTIKHTVDLETIKSRNPDTVKKEILLGIAAYSLIRGLIARGTKELGLTPRDVSFTRALLAIEIATDHMVRATTRSERQREYDLFLRNLRTAKHPKRTKPRVEPRAIAGTIRKKFPALKGTREEARAKILEKLAC